MQQNQNHLNIEKVNDDVWDQINWFGQGNKSTNMDRWDDCLFKGSSCEASSKVVW